MCVIPSYVITFKQGLNYFNSNKLYTSPKYTIYLGYDTRIHIYVYEVGVGTTLGSTPIILNFINLFAYK